MTVLAYIKPTNFCNVGCSHCYLPEETRASRFKMSFDILRDSANLLRDLQASRRTNSAHIIWHGGEPLVIKSDWYFKAGEILDEILPNHSESMQTSLIPYNHSFADLFHKRFNSHAGSSIDFSQRKTKDGVEGYHKLWMEKVDMARADNISVVPGVVPTVKEISREKYIVNWFNEREFPSFNIDRYNKFGLAVKDCPNNSQHSDFLISLFDALMDSMEKIGKAPIVNVASAAINAIRFRIPGDRWGGTCTSDFVVVEPDGALNNCPDTASHETPYSYVQDGFQSFASSPCRRKSIRDHTSTHKKPHCATCRFNDFCKSGCPITDNVTDGSDECSGYWRYLDHVEKYVKKSIGVIEAYLNQTVVMK